jgi:hypothetical protein
MTVYSSPYRIEFMKMCNVEETISNNDLVHMRSHEL